MANGMDELTLQSRISFVTDEYTGRNDMIDGVIDLYKQDFDDIKEDVGGQGVKPSDASYIQMVRPGRGQAIIQKFLTTFLHASDMLVEAMPMRKATSRAQDKLLTNIEYYLRGIMDESDYETHDAWLHGGVWWYLMGGMMTLKTLYFPHLRDSEEFPIKIFAPDARTIYPVFHNHRVAYLVERYDRYVLDMREELESLYMASGKQKVWYPPDFMGPGNEPLDDTDEVEVTEYWDDTYHALYVGDNLVWNKEHEYPCLPYSLTFCLPTPLSDYEWKGRPILASSEDALKNEALSLSKLQTASETMFFPIVLVRTADDELVQLQTGPNFPVTPIPEDAVIQVINPQPNVALLQAVINSFVSDISRNTLPEMMWSQPPSPARSGYAEQIRFMGTEADLRFMAKRIAQGLAHAMSNILRITEKFAGRDGFRVFTMRQGEQRHELLTMKASDVDGHHRVRVQLNPQLPKDQVQQMQLARFAREISPVTNEQLLPDAYIMSEILNVSDPVSLEKQRLQEVIHQDPLVQAWRRKKGMEEFWRREGATKKEIDELRAELLGPQPTPPEEVPMPIPPRVGNGQGEMPMGMPPGGTPWGMPPEVLAPELGGLGRSQVQTPEENAELAALITGRPPGS